MRPILSASLQNCHAVGLDSIVFKATAPMVRVFVAHENHTLWLNNPNVGTQMSLGVHEHRTDITMIPLFGMVFNVFPSPHGPIRNFVPYVFSSKIRDGRGGFERHGDEFSGSLLLAQLKFPTSLPGRQKHSVYVQKGMKAAWMIAEGDDNKNYSPVMYSNDLNLEHADFSHLYQPMTPERLNLNMDILSKYSNL